MEQTPNYKLNKPGYEEFGDVEVLNQNFAAIDIELKKNADAVGERVKTTELAEKVKQTVKDGSLAAKDLGAVSADTKGKANGVAGLDGNGKVPSGQLPEMNYEGKGAVDTHNTSTSAHSALFSAKQDKLKGKKGKYVGFTADNVVGEVDAPAGGESDSGVGELQDTEMEVGTITNAGAGWNTYHFREAFEGVPQVTCQAEDFDGVVLVKDITAEGFLYCLRTLQTGTYYIGTETGTNPSHKETTLVSGTTTTADAVKINYIAVEYGGER
ncbi:hypothetical protein DW742_11495 [Butyricicoccus sp. AM28-25]|nr:hypothetical protein [Butyricicoccus sp. AM28-25]RHT73623.1 hypothetical protein DW742_11495 [Butyricicoccus sp. AM28-25]